MTKLRDEMLREPLRGVVPVAKLDWGGRDGQLVLAPGLHASGGAWSNHLIFLWHKRGVDYALSLHAWPPIDEAVASLKKMVDSLPR